MVGQRCTGAHMLLAERLAAVVIFSSPWLALSALSRVAAPAFLPPESDSVLSACWYSLWALVLRSSALERACQVSRGVCSEE